MGVDRETQLLSVMGLLRLGDHAREGSHLQEDTVMPRHEDTQLETDGKGLGELTVNRSQLKDSSPAH